MYTHIIIERYIPFLSLLPRLPPSQCCYAANRRHEEVGSKARIEKGRRLSNDRTRRRKHFARMPSAGARLRRTPPARRSGAWLRLVSVERSRFALTSEVPLRTRRSTCFILMITPAVVYNKHGFHTANMADIWLAGSGIALHCIALHCIASCPVLSCPVLSCPVLSCPSLSCPVLSCPIQSSPISSGPVLHYTTLHYTMRCAPLRREPAVPVLESHLR